MLTTVLFVDMVGATARVVVLGDRRWREVEAQYTARVRQELARHGGEEMNTVGDEILAVFDVRSLPSAADALSAMLCRGSGRLVRVGIHAGEVEYDDRTISGITAHKAS